MLLVGYRDFKTAEELFDDLRLATRAFHDDAQKMDKYVDSTVEINPLQSSEVDSPLDWRVLGMEIEYSPFTIVRNAQHSKMKFNLGLRSVGPPLLV